MPQPPHFFTTTTGRKIAYHKTDGQGPTVVFLLGLKSDMEGSKAIFLEDWAKANGRPFLRFDYSGHGQSSDAFTDGCIGDWANDAQEAIESLTDGPVLLVGSSMGGWISLLLTKRLNRPIVGLVGIAAAPDFTEDSMWAGFSNAQKAALDAEGFVALPSEYGDPYIITKRMIEDGRHQLVLRDPLPLPFPVRLVQGTKDTAVLRDVPLRILDHVTCDDITLTFKKDADHSFSTPDCLEIIRGHIEAILAIKE
ncbi:MAG: alpha/beta fold hydrolase [Halocynthiibacter sp.]